MKVTRRKHLHQLGAALLAPCGIATFSPLIAAQANSPAWRQGLSLFGDLKYPAKFPRFDYASSSAPTGGRVRQGALGSYDNFNMVTEGARGNLAIGIELIYDTLLLPSMDEASSAYGLLAEAVAYPGDFSWVRYRLRPEARWHDGTSVGPEDVMFSFEAFKKYSPRLHSYYRHVVKAEITGEREKFARTSEVSKASAK